LQINASSRATHSLTPPGRVNIKKSGKPPVDRNQSLAVNAQKARKIDRLLCASNCIDDISCYPAAFPLAGVIA
jgi:hypothetical protein